MKQQNFLIKNISELVTLAPLAESKKLTGITNDDLGKIKNAWLAIKGGRVHDFGSGPVPKMGHKFKSIDAKGGYVMPGLVDCHTHPIFAGNRAKEFAMRLDGMSYQEIGQQGGGIKYTVKQTRAASEKELTSLTLNRLSRFLKFGVTTVETKTGYGASVSEEIRLLKILNKIKKQTRQEIKITCLALHAMTSEYDSVEQFVQIMTEELLPKVKKDKLADYVDAFVENGYFSAAQAEDPYIKKAMALGLKIRIHADEFSDSGAAIVAANCKAASADHLECASEASIIAMAISGCVAVLLPGTSLYTAIKYANARRFIDHGVPVALATDFNPGSCQFDNLPFIAAVGALHCKLKPAEAIAAATYVPAVSLDLGSRKGALAKNFDADFLIYRNLHSSEEWLSDIGKTPPDQVWIRGVVQK